MDIKVAERAAAGPEEAVEMANLPKQLAGFARPGGYCAAAGLHAIAAQQEQVTDFPIRDAPVQFLERTAMTRHKANADL